MSSKGKFYLLNPTVYDARSADIAKLPPQQQKILRIMRDHCTEQGMKGSDIVALAVEKLNLETRQKFTVLYAWYARSNENYGVYTGHEVQVSELPTGDDGEPLVITPAPTPIETTKRK
jgi:hypothetical protein